MIANANSIRIPLADKSVHMCVTSPPYYGLRDYGLPGTEWAPMTYAPMAGLPKITVPGCESECEHVWSETKPIKQSTPKARGGRFGCGNGVGRIEKNTEEITISKSSHWCQKCGGWRGCLGLEPTPEMFVAHIVAVMREVWRVLRDDATCWLNFGDSYATTQAGNTKWGNGVGTNKHYESGATGLPKRYIPQGIKPKDLIGIPWRVAFALQADGWYLRNDIIWHKTNPMPESVKDRCTKGHEYLFLLAKSKRYFYDNEAIKEPAASTTNSTRNKRDVWALSTRPYKGAHFATFPATLVEPCVLAGTSAEGVCPVCGNPWKRIVRKKLIDTKGWGKSTKDHTGSLQGTQSMMRDGKGRAGTSVVETIDWQPTCNHDAEPIPAVVLDPFCGSGTTGEVCGETGRKFIGVDLSRRYLVDFALFRAEGKRVVEDITNLPLFNEL